MRKMLTENIWIFYFTRLCIMLHSMSAKKIPKCCEGDKNSNFTESQNVLRWNGLTRIIESNFLPCTGYPQESHHLNSAFRKGSERFPVRKYTVMFLSHHSKKDLKLNKRWILASWNGQEFKMRDFRGTKSWGRKVQAQAQLSTGTNSPDN